MHTWFNAFHHFSFSWMFASVFSYFRSAYLNNSLLYIWIRSFLSHLKNIHVLFAFWCPYFMIKWHWSSSKLCQRKRELLLYQQKGTYRQYKMMLILFHAWTYNGIFIDVWYFGFCLECISWEMSKIIFVDMCVI